MLQEINKLPEQTLTLLQMGSCIGLTFSVTMLQLILDEQNDNILKNLQSALQCGLIQPLFSQGASAKLNNMQIIKDVSETVPFYVDTFIFLHDKVHESCYSSIDSATRKKLHFTIGTTMLDLMEQTPELEKDLFRVIHHLKEGEEYITDLQQALRVVDTAIKASTVATEMGTHAQALSYSLFARSLLQRYYPDDDECWKIEYKRCFAILLRACESRSVLHQPEVLDEFEVAFQRVADPVQRIDVYMLQFNHLCSQQQVPETVSLTKKVMEEYGHNIPDDYSYDTFRRETSKFLQTEAGETLEEKFCSLPLVTDDNLTDALINFIVVASPSFYIMDDFVWWAYLLHFCCSKT